LPEKRLLRRRRRRRRLNNGDQPLVALLRHAGAGRRRRPTPLIGRSGAQWRGGVPCRHRPPDKIHPHLGAPGLVGVDELQELWLLLLLLLLLQLLVALLPAANRLDGAVAEGHVLEEGGLVGSGQRFAQVEVAGPPQGFKY
jgi:hypothetical protein